MRHIFHIEGKELKNRSSSIRFRCRVKAAREIHERIDAISPELENRIGQPISMHTGINTGLVVTGEVDMERGTHGVAGGTINLASRLSNLAKPGEFLVDADTCLQAESHFTCEYLEETIVKGKADPVQVHKVLSQRDKPVTIHRLSGLRANLVGRKAELTELSEAVDVYGEELNLQRMKILVEGMAWKLERQLPLVEGLVISREGEVLLTDLAEIHGVKQYMKLIVFRPGQELIHPRTGRILKRPDTILGEARLTAVSDETAEATLLSSKQSSNVKELDKVITK